MCTLWRAAARDAARGRFRPDATLRTPLVPEVSTSHPRVPTLAPFAFVSGASRHGERTLLCAPSLCSSTLYSLLLYFPLLYSPRGRRIRSILDSMRLVVDVAPSSRRRRSALPAASCQQPRQTYASASSGISSVYPRAILKMGTPSIDIAAAEPAFNCPRSQRFRPSLDRLPHRSIPILAADFAAPASCNRVLAAWKPRPAFAIEGSLAAAAGYAILIPSPTSWPVLTPERSTVRTISRPLAVSFPSGYDPSESQDRAPRACSSVGLFATSSLRWISGGPRERRWP